MQPGELIGKLSELTGKLKKNIIPTHFSKTRSTKTPLKIVGPFYIKCKLQNLTERGNDSLLYLKMVVKYILDNREARHISTMETRISERLI